MKNIDKKIKADKIVYYNIIRSHSNDLKCLITRYSL